MSKKQQDTHKIILDLPCFDWFTLTSYDRGIFAQFKHLFDSSDDIREAKRMQYGGELAYLKNGSAFVGTGIQAANRHHMIQISGGLAHDERMTVWDCLREKDAKLTRVDCQVTILHPKEWDDNGQWRLFNRLKRGRKTVGWVQSNDAFHGELATVYIGALKSEKFVRVYQKPVGDDNLGLRFEAVFKGQSARTFGQMWSSNKIGEGSAVRGMIEWAGDDILLNTFMYCLDGYDPTRPKVVRPETKTERWLLKQVLPTFQRVINADDGNGKVLREFLSAINDVINQER